MTDKIKSFIDVREFSRRISDSILNREGRRHIFFVGAGCSKSSGVPLANELTHYWFEKLYEIEHDEKSDENFGKWKQKKIEQLNTMNVYGGLIKELFKTPDARQEEIEKRIRGKDPGFGYAVLAKLMDKHKNCNVVLTTNFDDLIADALYLYTDSKPQIIDHNLLIGYSKPGGHRPLIIKLHGDGLIDPKNTDDETRTLDLKVKDILKCLFRFSTIIFVGYGGKDRSIKDLFESIPLEVLQNMEIYWVNKVGVFPTFNDLLKDNRATCVNYADFDVLMFLILKYTGLEIPTERRSNKAHKYYVKTLEEFIEREDIKEDVRGALDKVNSWWAIQIKAKEYEIKAKTSNEEKQKEENIKEAKRIYEEGLDQFKGNANLHCSYAEFLRRLKKYDEAAIRYLAAINLDTKNVNTLIKYACFLQEKLEQGDENRNEISLKIEEKKDIEKIFEEALDFEPTNAETLISYAYYLDHIKHDYVKAEENYKKALKIDKNDEYISKYAYYEHRINNNYDFAENCYKEAVDLNPTNALNLGRYGQFLDEIRNQKVKAEDQFIKALEIESENGPNLRRYAVFLYHVGNYAEAEKYFKKSLQHEKNAITMSQYAYYLHNYKKDYSSAIEMYREAIKLPLSDSSAYSNFALLLYEIFDHQRAELFFQKAEKIQQNNIVNMGRYAYFLFKRNNEKDAAKLKLEKALKINCSNIMNQCYLAEIERNLDVFKKLEEREKDNAKLLVKYALTLWEENKIEEAEEKFKRALGIDGYDYEVITAYLDFKLLTENKTPELGTEVETEDDARNYEKEYQRNEEIKKDRMRTFEDLNKRKQIIENKINEIDIDKIVNECEPYLKN